VHIHLFVTIQVPPAYYNNMHPNVQESIIVPPITPLLWRIW